MNYWEKPKFSHPLALASQFSQVFAETHLCPWKPSCFSSLYDRGLPLQACQPSLWMVLQSL